LTGASETIEIGVCLLSLLLDACRGKAAKDPSEAQAASPLLPICYLVV
jgi:hypothetical protein